MYGRIDKVNTEIADKKYKVAYDDNSNVGENIKCDSKDKVLLWTPWLIDDFNRMSPWDSVL